MPRGFTDYWLLTTAFLPLRSLQKFLLPSHLDGFQLAFVRLLGIIFELRQLRHIAMQIGKADTERVNFGMLLGQQNSYIFGIVPGEFWRHGKLLANVSTAVCETFIHLAAKLCNPETLKVCPS